MPYATAKDGTQLYYKDWGSGRPVVLIHGWPFSGDTFDVAAVALAERGFRAIIPDRRGFGRSDQPWDGYDYDTFADDLAAVILEAGVKEPVALAGFSMGGGEVARFITRHGAAQVSHAILIGAVVPFLLRTDDNPNGAPREVFDGMIEGIRKDRGDFFRTFFKSFFGEGKVSEAVLDDAWRQAMNAGLRPTLACVRAFSETDFRPDLRNFTMPTLVIHGVGDETVPIAISAHEAAKAVPGAKLIEYQDGAHGVFASNKDELTCDLLEFLETGERSAQSQHEAKAPAY
jgi:pimeloyl-ACP methyl ester carboxylesterase